MINRPPGGVTGVVPKLLGPVAAPAGVVQLRPLSRRDGRDWRRIRIRDVEYLRPWDVSSTQSWERRHSGGEWRRHRRQLRVATLRGEAWAFAIEVDGAFAGQVTFGGIQRGALRSGWVGYWVDSERHGGGVATTAVAIAVDFAFGSGGLHRVEATIAPANAASRKVVGHLGFRQEGVLERYLDIDGRWQDHLLFALTAGEIPGGLVARLRNARG